ncbi:MAG: polysaccharide deacetylase family protein [Calditrichaeota bacterium]|nr:MAG: polysaccharide deacetylase family protein [Calditrichota bacterium]MBL1203910.1 polysaccharide deacetylase family protein [Calditrichota bacterium]NOG43743.1 polysaccharide deacetylase family protein [Calditrichota bacterium]
MIPPNLLILNYHKIESRTDIGITTRHPDDFRKDLKTLVQKGYQTVNFYDLKKPEQLPEKPVIITFDDAYLSFYESAFKILKEHKMKAVVFVPVNFINKKNEWDVQLFGKKYRHMSEDQLREISENNIEIGSHTLNHKYLNDLQDHELVKELELSKTKLESIVGKNIISISYPFGKFNNRVLQFARKYYDFDVGLLPSFFQNSNSLRPFERINIYRIDSQKDFQKKLEYKKYPGLKAKNRLIQFGSWATILLKKLQVQNG